MRLSWRNFPFLTEPQVRLPPPTPGLQHFESLGRNLALLQGQTTVIRWVTLGAAVGGLPLTHGFQLKELDADMEERLTSKHSEVNDYDYEVDDRASGRGPIISVSLNDEQTSSSGSPESSLHLSQSRSRRKSILHAPRFPSFGKPKAPDSPDSQKEKDGKHRERTDSGGSDTLRRRVSSFASLLGHKHSDDSLKDKNNRPRSVIAAALPKPRVEGGLVPSLEPSPTLIRKVSAKLSKPRDSISSAK